MATLILPNESYKIVGCCFEVYNELGSGFLEAVYQEALEIELRDRSVEFVAQPELPLAYKNHALTKTYRPDFICYGQIVLEIKAVSKLTDDHRAQILNYLAATRKQLGILVNFGGHPKLEHERYLPRPTKHPTP